MNTDIPTNGQSDGVEVEIGGMELLEGSAALEAVDRASIDVQVSTAHRFPRSVDKALKEALTLATLDEDTAASMFYALRRGGKTIEGPSARLAEVMAYSWGNLRVDADIVAEDRTHVTAMGTCFDLEKNVAVRVRVKRRITDSRGKRYNEDMIGVTSNAAISIALRNAVFKVIPSALSNRIYSEARTASLGKGGTITQKRQKALDWFANLGIKDAQVFAVLGVRGLDDIGEDELITLRGLVTAIKDGETSVEQAFARATDSEAAAELTEALTDEDAAPKPATKKQIAGLEDLRDKARELDLLSSSDEESIAAAIESKDVLAVREETKKVSKSLAQAAGDGQGSLV